MSDHDSNVSDHDSNRLPSGGNLGWGPSGPNPSCLGTVIGPSAQPILGGLRPPWGLTAPGGFAPIGATPPRNFFVFTRNLNFVPLRRYLLLVVGGGFTRKIKPPKQPPNLTGRYYTLIRNFFAFTANSNFAPEQRY